MKKILALLYLFLMFFAGTTFAQRLNAPSSVCTSMGAANTRFGTFSLSGYSGTRTRWTLYKGSTATPAILGTDYNVLYGYVNTISNGNPSGSTNNRSITIEFLTDTTYLVRAETFTNTGSTVQTSRTATVNVVDCPITVCKGSATSGKDFKETFGTVAPGAQVALDPARGSIQYIYQSTYGLNDNYYAISSQMQLRTEWDQSLDHTRDGTGGLEGAMLVANSAIEKKEFYSREVRGLCPGAVYNFSAWFRNANGKGVLENNCQNDYIYAGVTFEVRDLSTNALLASFNTNDVSMPLHSVALDPNGGWQKYGGTFKTNPNATSLTDVKVIIKNNNPGGCGNDIAIDDIEFAYCAPNIFAFFDGQKDQEGGEYTMCAGSATNLNSEFQPADYFKNPVYRWEYSDNGTTWIKINGDGDGLTGSTTDTLHFAADSKYLIGDSLVTIYKWFRLTINEGTASSLGCEQPSKPIRIELLPNPKINVAGAQICKGETATLTACCRYDEYKWRWPTPTPTDSTFGDQIDVSPTVTTEYEVIGRKDYGAGRTCYRRATAPVIIDTMPILQLNLTGPNPICFGQSVTLEIDPSNLAYDIQWRPTGDIGNTTTHTPATVGPNKYNVDVTNGACVAKDSITINVIAKPSVTVGTILSSCSNTGRFTIPYSNPLNNPARYDVVAAGANPMPGFTNVLNQPLPASPITVTYPTTTAPGTYTFNLVLRNPTLGCDSIRPISVTVVAPLPVPTGIIASSTDLCVNSYVTVTVQGPALPAGARWAWYSGTCGGTYLGTGTSISVGPLSITTDIFVRAENAASPCPASNCAQKRINVYPMPGNVDAGLDQNNCDDSTFIMTANQPATNTAKAVWTVMSATGVPISRIIISDITKENTQVIVPLGASATLNWGTPNGVCPGKDDQITLTNYINPANLAEAGPKQRFCNVTSFTLNATALTAAPTAAGTWTRIAGNAAIVISDIHDPKATVTNVIAGDSIVLRWTVTNGPVCPSAYDDVTLVSYRLPSAAVAGPNRSLCNVTSFTLAATAPAIGTGVWRTIYGTRTVANATSPTSTITVAPGDSIILEWSVTNGNCNVNRDTVTLVSYRLPSTAVAGPNLRQCNVTSFTMAATAPAVGTGVWRTIYGTRTVANATNPTSTITVAPGDSILLEWSVTNGNCAVSRDTVTLVSYRLPSAAVAGPNLRQCNVTSFTMAATAPAVGTGVWRTIYGTRTVANATNPASTITVAPGDSILLEWSVTNGTCNVNRDTVTLVSYRLPSTAVAGPNLRQCNVTSFTMAATAPAVGTGVWRTIYGTRTVANATSPTSTITVAPGDSILLEWSVTNGNCAVNRDTVTLVSYRLPSTAVAGPNLKQCNVTSFTMAATAPTVGTGVWRTIYGTRTVANATSPTSTITVAPGDSILLEWSVTNGNCAVSRDTVTLVSYQLPSAAVAGPNLRQCNVTSFTMAATAPAVGTGVWRTIYGTRTVANATSPTSTITVAPGDSILLEWSVTNGNCNVNRDTVTLVSYRLPSAAVAGPNLRQCNVTSFTMAATAPAVGTGVWRTIYGTRTVANATSPTSTIAVAPGDSIILEWSVTNGNCAVSRDTVTLVSYRLPSAAVAGPNLRQCNVTSFTMAATAPAVGTGVWRTIYGSRTVANATNPASTITVAPGDSILLEWSVTNGTCAVNRDTVTLVSYRLPSAAVAGPNLKLCGATSFTLAATAPAVGTGRWTTIYGTRTATNPTSPTSTIPAAPGDSIILVWTVSNGNCTANTDTVTLVSYQTASTAVAGADQRACNVTSFTLAANTPAIGTGSWSTLYGTRTVANPASPNTTITVAPGDSIRLIWTITNGSNCSPSRDTITLVSYRLPSAAVAGPNLRQCNVTSFTMAATAPAVGTGVWRTIYGTRTVANATSPTSTITVAPGDSILLEWSVTNGNCNVNRDTVTLVSYRLPSAAVAGPNLRQCNVTSFTMAATAPAVGTGVWRTIYGTRTVANATSPTSTITVAPGDSIILEWSVTNGNCAVSRDTVTLVSYRLPSAAVAGPNLRQCNVTSFTMAATAPAVGTGVWRTIYGSRTVANATNPASTITVAPGDSILLEWSVTNGNCAVSRDTVTLVSYRLPSAAVAGPNLRQCNVTSFTMAATAPAVGTGVWRTIYGTRTVANATSPTSTITVAPGDSIILEWSVTNGNCAVNRDTVTLVSYRLPSTAVAGPDLKQCNVTSFTMAATAPAVGTGVWRTIYGTRTVANATSPTSTITVAPGDSILLEWSVTNGNCAVNRDTVTLVSYRLPSAAVAGPDQRLCNVASFTLAATAPAVGTGRWRTIYGTRTVANATNPTTTIAVTPGDSIRLEWSVSNGNCTVNRDTITLVSYRAEAPANAGTSLRRCNVNTFTLSANAPTVATATGRWSIVYGTPTLSSMTDPRATVTVAIGDSVVLRWTITNGACGTTSSDVTLVSYQQAAVADAGPNQRACNVTSFTMAANAPGVATATGTWTKIYGNGTISNIHDPRATVTVAVGDSVVYRWTIMNGTCPVTTDDVTLVSDAPPTTPAAGPDQQQCGNGNFTLAANRPTIGAGRWTIVSGTATIANVTSPTTTVQVPAGGTVTLRWTISNGQCPAVSDDITLSNLNAVLGNTITADQTICLNEAAAPLGGGTLTGGNGTYTYQWQSSTVSATTGFANIPGATNATYSPGTLTQDSIWFRRVVNSGPCMNNISNAVKIMVITKPPVVVFVPAPLTVNCKLGMDYTTLFGTPQFSHTPYIGQQLTVTFTDASTINGCVRTFTRTWTAADRCGMTTTASQTITVVDNDAPVFQSAAPANITVNCDAIPAPVNLTAYDSCFGVINVTPTETRQNIAGACANNYRLIRTWTATDGCNNSVTLTQTITVQDTTRPVFTVAPPRDTTVNCNSVPAAATLTATDNCTPGVITVTATDVRQNIPGAQCADYYQIIRTWIARDECGNTATVKQTITVQDTTRPVFSIPQPADVTVDCDKVPAWPVVTATDNCSANVQVVTSEQRTSLLPACANNYRLIRTWTAKDNCGNTATMRQIITVQDTTRPVFTVAPPRDTTVSCDAVPPPANNVIATDNCAGNVKLSRSQIRETIPGACASNYRLIRTWTATDECGNTTTVRQVVTVTDTTRPVIAPAPADLVVNCGDSIPVAPVLTATDNCDPAFPKTVTVVEDPYVKDLCAGYTIIRRWRIADACGNQATERVQRITVNPCPKPVLDPALPMNCSDNPSFTLKLSNQVNNPTYILVGVTPANAVQVPLAQKSATFNLNNATQASFIVQDGVTGCVSDTVVYNLQYSNKPMVYLGNDTTICGGNSLILDAGAANFGYTIRWSTGETTQRIQVSAAGTYWVSVTNGVCVTTDTIHVELVPMPLVNLPDAAICRGQSVKLDAFVDGASYLWSTGATTSSILVSTQEEFWVRVTKSGCITIDTVKVTVNPPPDISLNRDTLICPDQSIMLTVNVANGGSIRWATGATTSSIVVNQPGLYWVTVTRDNCMVRDTVNVRLQPGITVELGPNQEICPGNSITVDGTTQDAISYLWDDGDSNPVKAFNATGKYRLAVMDRFCQRVYMDSLNVRVMGTPFINLGNDTMMCIGETLRLRADGSNITRVLWSDGSTGPFLDVTKAGTYSVTVFNDCGSYTDQITVDYTQCDPKPTFPNAFSPNNDGRNDFFRPVVRGPMYEYELRIFNRWGELIYLGRDSKKGWDGRYQGQLVGVGTYVWWLTYKKMPNGNPNIIKGEVTVIR